VPSSEIVIPDADPGDPARHSITLRGLSEPIPEMPADTPIRAVEHRLVRGLPAVPAVSIATAEGPALLTRYRLDALLGGRLGFGRALLSRAVVGDVVDPAGFSFGIDDSLAEAAQTLLERRSALRDEWVLVVDEDGGRWAVSVAAVFREVGLVFRDIALRDPLTGLPNRRMLDARGEELIAQGVSADRLSVLYVDLDGFKLVNDLYGHRVGDDLLIAVARRLAESVRRQDLVGRIGGDEFAVLLVDVDDAELDAIAERVVASARECFVVDGNHLYGSASVGVARGRMLGAGESPNAALGELLQRADGAMLAVKRSGKGRAAYDELPGGDDQVERRALVQRKLRGAIEDDLLELHYQPKLDLRTDQISSVEALVRWTDPVLGRVSPGEIVPVAEHSGQVGALSDWVLATACRQARRWRDRGIECVVAVNVSPIQLAAPGLVQDVLGAVETAGIPPELLVVEVTESRALVDVALAVAQLTELRAAGVAVHLDDFGAGYSSLSVLRALPLDVIKIDRSIVDRIDSDEADARLVAGVIEAAHILGMAVVGEGVERETQLDRLRALGCDYAQGYLIGRPCPAAEVEHVLSAELAPR